MPDTIGQQLKQARLGKNLSIDDAVQATRIRAHYIQALEADDFESLPSAAQTRGFLKLYSEFLDLSLDDLLIQQRKTTSVSENIPDLVTSQDMDVNKAGSFPEPETKLDAPETIKKNSSTAGRRTRKVPEIVTQPSQALYLPENEHDLSDKSLGIGDTTGSPASLLSQSLFSAIGMALRQRREALSLSLEEIERHIHVRKHYLDALETGEYDHLPSSVQARGMLQNYAGFLGLDVDTLLLKVRRCSPGSAQ